MKHANKILIFIINGLLVVIAVILMRDHRRGQAVSEESTNLDTDPVSAAVKNTNGSIAADRETKLRGLADSPKTIKKETVTTQTTTSTPTSTTTKTS